MKSCCPGVLMLLVCLLVPGPVPRAHATHPLVTDDAYTQGKGKWQLELNGQWGQGNSTVADATGFEVTTSQRAAEVRSAVTYGIVETVDLILNVPYQWKRSNEDGAVSDVNGIADLSFETKWRFFEKDGLKLAIKPGISLPAGDQDKDLGTGRVGYYAFFIATQDSDPFAVHVNLGYRRNENGIDQRRDLWHASIAGEYRVLKPLRIVANIGQERNPERGSNVDPAFVLGGLIYSPLENFDIDAGIKAGLNSADTSMAFLFGLTLRF